MIKEEDKTLFMLIGDVHRQFGHQVRDLEKQSGLGTCVNCILFELDRHGDLTQVEIVNKIHMRPSSISVALQKMEVDGLIERKTKDDDQRYTIVSITDKGKESCMMRKKQVRELDDYITSNIVKYDLVVVKRVLREISTSFKGGNNENI